MEGNVRDGGHAQSWGKPTGSELRSFGGEEQIKVIALKGSRQFGAIRLYLIHPISGSSSSYLRLAGELPPNLEVLGLDLPEDLGGHFDGNVLDELGERYAKVISDHQGHGPFFVAGWSIGATIAYRCAIHLERVRRDFTLFLIDGAPNSGVALQGVAARELVYEVWRAYTKVMLTGEHLLTFWKWVQVAKPTRQKRIAEIHRMRHEIPDSTPLPSYTAAAWAQFRFIKRVYLTRNDAPGSIYSGRTRLFLSDSFDTQATFEAWRALCTSLVDFEFLEGGHLDNMRSERHVRRLARKLLEAIQYELAAPCVG